MKKLKMQNKSAELTSEQTIAIILVILLLVVVVLMLKHQFFIDWVRNLPNYAPPNETEIDVSKLSDAEIKNFCPDYVGKSRIAEDNIPFSGIVAELLNIKQSYIFLNENGNLRQTRLYIKKNLILVAPGNKAVGGIYDNSIIIKDFSEQSLKNDLERLDNAWFVKGNLICRSEEK